MVWFHINVVLENTKFQCESTLWKCIWSYNMAILLIVNCSVCDCNVVLSLMLSPMHSPSKSHSQQTAADSQSPWKPWAALWPSSARLPWWWCLLASGVHAQHHTQMCIGPEGIKLGKNKHSSKLLLQLLHNTTITSEVSWWAWYYFQYSCCPHTHHCLNHVHSLLSHLLHCSFHIHLLFSIHLVQSDVQSNEGPWTTHTGTAWKYV